MIEKKTGRINLSGFLVKIFGTIEIEFQVKLVIKMVVHFYLVRHGQTKLNRSRRLQGVTNSPLTKKGVRMAKRLGNELKDLKFEAVYTSDLKRTQETARFIIEENTTWQPTIYTDPDLREISFGRFEEAQSWKVAPKLLKKLGFRKIIQAFLNQEHVAELTELFQNMDETELIEDSDHLNQRMCRALTNIGNYYQKRGGGNVLIVTHGLILSSFVESLQGDVPMFLLDNARASRIDYHEDGHFEIIFVNKRKPEDTNVK